MSWVILGAIKKTGIGDNRMVFNIHEISELDGLEAEGYLFCIDAHILRIKNKKEGFEINFNLCEVKRLKLAKSIERLTGIRVEFDKLDKRETLSYIESKGFNKSIWNPVGKAMHTYNMIEPGDRIAVGISGGKDSLVTLHSLIRIKNIVDFDFDIIPIHVHYKKLEGELEEVKKHVEKLGLELQIEETNIKEIVFEEKKLKNPCFMCARMRRGVLYRVMQEKNINKLALGHHKDDIIETFLMNMFYQGNRNVMKPSYHSDNYDLRVIRPLSYVEEEDIVRYARKVKLPILKSSCEYEVDKNSRRLRVKNLIKDLSKENSEIRSVIFKSIKDLLV